MEFSWTTFVLEIINFLVLVWILTHFLYKPVKNIIEARKESIQKTFDDANKSKNEALELQKKYENRLSDWENEKQIKHTQLQQELLEEKKRQMLALEALLNTEKQKFQVREKQHLATIFRKKQKEADLLALKFIAQILKQFADSELENKICKLFLNELSSVLKDKIETLLREFNDKDLIIKIKSAFILKEEQIKDLRLALQNLFNDKKTDFDFSIDESLLAGLHVTIGSVVLHANLRDELQYFSAVTEC